MMQNIQNKSDKSAPYLYFMFRFLVGLAFFLHGVQKFPGIMDGTASALVMAAGAIELAGGAFLLVGLFTRYVAVVSAIEMLVAFFMVHAKDGLNPIINKGEPALLFFAAFLVLIAYGPGKWALENMFKKKQWGSQ